MKTRKNFLLTLLGVFGAAKAQQPVRIPPPGTNGSGSADMLGVGDVSLLRAPSNPSNNQCPVCGTMAEPYKLDGIDCGIYGGGRTPTGSGCRNSNNLTRCSHCSVAFWQDVK